MRHTADFTVVHLREYEELTERRGYLVLPSIVKGNLQDFEHADRFSERGIVFIARSLSLYGLAVLL
jgi:hypothetical protein